jgi:ABC-type oligopeptide transport system substrate-binding subunit/class 3 adenylate cyclase
VRFCFECGSEVGSPEELAAAPSGLIEEHLQRLVPREFAERLRSSGGDVAGERRVVTILFCDVTGSTAMAEELDPEDVMEIMDGAFDVLIEPIVRYEGTVARLMGDAVLAFFGAPIAHEDDPERACRAALEVVEGAQAYGERLERKRGVRGFDVRVGINTGLVVVGEVGSDLRVEYTAMGDAINLAARMESAAEPGTILITEETHKLVAPQFEMEALGPVEVKGKAEPVSTYRVLKAKPAPGKARGIAGLESPLVGREEEFEALRQALERLEAGVGGVVTIVGEAGIGKSRLVAELRRRRATHGRTGSARRLGWVEGRCLSYGTSVAYLLWLDVLRGLLGVTPDEAPAQVLDVLTERVEALCPDSFEEVYSSLGGLMSLPLESAAQGLVEGLDGRQLRAKTFGALKMMLGSAAEDQPLVVVCEDLHWADPTSVLVLEHVLALTDRVPLLFVCVFRPRREHGSWRLRETAGRDYGHRHTDLWLKRLGAEESATLVGNLLRLEALPRDLRDRILDHAGGNPFYVEEIIRSLIDEGAIVRDEVSGRWEATKDVEEIPIPDTLHGVLMARIDRLQAETKRVLQMASVIGRVFLYRVLAAIAEEERELDERLLNLQREEMIRERARLPELEYIFKHELTREAAYNGLLKKERLAFHRQAGEALERLFSERLVEQMGLLAYHYERAGDTDKAIHYLLKAGDRARTMYAHEEAIDYYERALAFMRAEEDDERAARTLMKMGLAHHSAFDFKRSRRSYEEAFALLEQVREREPDAVPPAPHALRVPWSERPTLDPALAGDVSSVELVRQLFAGLVALSPELDVLPDAAQSWIVRQGGREYVFRLRDDVRWSDGNPVTAGDFEYAWKRVLNPVTDSQSANLLYNIEGARVFHRGEVSDPSRVGVRAKDDLTLAVDLEAPTGYFLQLLTHTVTFPVPRHVIERHGEAWTEAGNMVGNGSFKLAGWERGRSIVLARNPHYHGRCTGNVQKVELPFARDDEHSLRMYEAGEVDYFEQYSQLPEVIDRVRAFHGEEYVTGPGLTTWYLGFNVRRPPFDDARVRRAFGLAIDRHRLPEVGRDSGLEPATGGLVPPGMPGHSTGIGLQYDPKRARQLLAEAGCAEGRGLPAVRGMGPHRGLQWLRGVLETQWRETLGVEIEWEAMEWTAYLEKLYSEGPAELFLLGWEADFPDPDNFLRASPHRSLTGWHNQAYDQLVEKAASLMDQAKRVRLYRQADTILMEEAPIVPLAYKRAQLLVQPWVRAFPISPIGGESWKDVVIEWH